MKKPFVVGIAGGTQSGKSTFAKELVDQLHGIPCKTFHMDDYHRPKDELPLVIAPITKQVYSDFNSPASFDLPQLRLDLKNEIEQNTISFIIVEGTLVLYDDEIRNALDLKLYVETQADERAIRYVASYPQHHGHDFIKNSYLDLVRYRMDEYVEPTKWSADIFLNGSLRSEQAIEIIKTYLLSKVSGRRITP